MSVQQLNYSSFTSKFSNFNPTSTQMPQLEKYRIIKMVSSGDYICEDVLGNTYLLVCQNGRSSLNQFRNAAKKKFQRNKSNRALITPFEDIEHEGALFTVYILPEKSISLKDKLQTKQNSDIFKLSLLYTIINKVVQPLFDIFDINTDKWLHLQNIWIKQSSIFYILCERNKNIMKKTEVNHTQSVNKQQLMQHEKHILHKLATYLIPFFNRNQESFSLVSMLLDAMLNQEFSLHEIIIVLNDKQKRKSFVDQRNNTMDHFTKLIPQNDFWKKRRTLFPNNQNLRNQIVESNKNRYKLQYQNEVSAIGENIVIPADLHVKKSGRKSYLFDMKNRINKKKKSLSLDKKDIRSRSLNLGDTQFFNASFRARAEADKAKYNTISISIQQKATKKFNEKYGNVGSDSNRYEKNTVSQEEDKYVRTFLLTKSNEKKKRSSTIEVSQLGKVTNFKIRNNLNENFNKGLNSQTISRENTNQKVEHLIQKGEQRELIDKDRERQRQRERERQRQRERQLQMKKVQQNQRQREKQRLRELEKEKEKWLKQMEKEKERQRQKQRERQIEKEKQRQRQRQKQRQRQRQRQRIRQLERQKKQRAYELEKKKELQKKLQIERQQEAQREKQRERQRQKEKERLKELEKKKQDERIKKQEEEKEKQKAKLKGIKNQSEKNLKFTKEVIAQANLDEVEVIDLKSTFVPKQKEKDAGKQKDTGKQKVQDNNKTKPPLPQTKIQQNRPKIQQQTSTIQKTEPAGQKKVNNPNPKQNRDETDSHQRTKTVTSEIASSCGPKKPVSKQVAEYMHMINKMGEGVAKSSKISAKLEGIEWFVGIYFVYKRFLLQRRKIQKWLESKTPNLTRYKEKNKSQWDEWFNSEEKATLQKKIKSENENILTSIIKMNKKIMKKSLPGNYLFHAALNKHSQEESKIAVSEVVKEFDILEEKEKLGDEDVLVHINDLLNAIYIIGELDGKIEERKPLIQILKKKTGQQLSDFSDYVYDLYIQQ